MSDLVKRLRGEYRTPITDGCGPPGGGSIQGGGDEPPPTHIEAADRIEALEAERDSAWNDALEAAAKVAEENDVGGFDEAAEGYSAACRNIAVAIRAMKREPGDE